MTCSVKQELLAGLDRKDPGSAPDTRRSIPLTKIARSFGNAAHNYDRHAELQRKVADQLLAKSADQVADAVILDLGCGTGYCSAVLHARYPQAFLLAVDLALPMLHASTRRELAALHPLCADAQVLPLQSQAVDLLVSSLTMQWCADPEQLFAELFRVTKPGGQVLLSTFGPATLAEIRRAWQAADGNVHVNDFIPLATLEQLCSRAGFACVAVTELRKPCYPSLRAVARELKGIGAHNMNRGQNRGLTSPAAFARAEAAFGLHAVAGQGVPVTYEVYYLNLRRPLH